MRRHHHIGLRLAAAVALLGAAGCSRPQSPIDSFSSTSGAEGRASQTRAVAEATQQAERDVRAAAQTLGGPLNGWQVTAVPCTDASGVNAAGGLWHLKGAATVAVANGDQVAAVDRLRDAWLREGRELTGQQATTGSAGGTAASRDTDTGLLISVTAAQGRGPIAISVDSDCYLPAPGESPAKG